MHQCPYCQSGDIVHKKYIGVDVIVCQSCGFDGMDELESAAHIRTSKVKESPYRTGGGRRTHAKTISGRTSKGKV